MDAVTQPERLGCTTTPRRRGIAFLNANCIANKDSTSGLIDHKTRPTIRLRDSDLAIENDVDITLIQKRTYLLSAGIGDTNRRHNKYKGKVGLVIWIFNVCIHFGLDFYEANTIFDISWATCIGLFLFTLVACCISMIKHSIPWFLKGVKKLKKDGNYPKTLKRVTLIARFMPLTATLFAVGAAVGQFGCYWADGALRVTFNNKNNSTVFVPKEVETFLNVLRATSLLHIFYGFCSLLVFHMTVIFMIQSSMKEYNERMGKLFREVPVSICFSDAVNLFSTRAKFVRDGSKRSSVVLTTLLVACCTSFVLNAYNFIFLKKYAIYIWFALAPLIWAVVPLIGAAWVTKTYWQYKLVVVNAWVDIPDEHELEDRAHAALHESHSPASRIKKPEQRMLGSSVSIKTGNSESNEKKDGNGGKLKGNDDAGIKAVKRKNSDGSGQKQNMDKKNKQFLNGHESKATTRRNSEVVIGFVSKSNNNKQRQEARRMSSSAKVPAKTPPPTILLTDYDEENVNRISPKTQLAIRLKPLSNRIKDSFRINSANEANTDVPQQDDTLVEAHDLQAGKDQNIGKVKDVEEYPEINEENKCTKQSSQFEHLPREVCIDVEPASEDDQTECIQRMQNPGEGNERGLSRSTSSSSLSSSDELVERNIDEENEKNEEYEENEGNEGNEVLKLRENEDENSGTKGHPNADTGSSEMRSETSLNLPGESTNAGLQKKPNFLSGMSKTFHKWRTKTKKKKHFNYEKYIIYLESILPNVGFSVGGVIIDWNGIYSFIVIMTFLVGVFAQEAFFGN